MAFPRSLTKALMVCLLVLAGAWLFEAVKESFEPSLDLRAFAAGAVISAMIAMLAIACVTRFHALRIFGAALGVILALREYSMFAMSDESILEFIREPSGWVGPVLFALFLLASVVAAFGKVRPGVKKEIESK